jgi:archaellum component FlaG (FlaF/FlaG flagellin family)
MKAFQKLVNDCVQSGFKIVKTPNQNTVVMSKGKTTLKIKSKNPIN